MKMKVIESSSRGNCYLLEDEGQILIIEAGIKIKKLKQELDFDFSQVVGCVITHEHKDHSESAKILVDMAIPVYMSNGTRESLKLSATRVKVISAMNVVKIGGFDIIPFGVQHDAAEPLGFLIRTPSGKRVVFATDTYYLENTFKNIHLYMIECNYDEDILRTNEKEGYINKHLAERIIKSHFSVQNVAKMLLSSDLKSCEQIVLLHLSTYNSNEKRMIEYIEDRTMVNTKVADDGLEVRI